MRSWSTAAVALVCSFSAAAQPSEEVLDAGVAVDAAPAVEVHDGGTTEDVADAGEPMALPEFDAGTLLADDRPYDSVTDEVDGGRPAPRLETVVVGTPETRVAGSAHTIKSARLNRFEFDDITAVLQAVPGISVRGEDGVGLRPNIGIRGANPDRSKKITLMEDGVLFGPAPYSAPAAYYFPLVTRMEAVRVVKGPASIMYGPQTVGGAIDYITRDIPLGVSAGLDAALGSYLYGKGHGYFSAANETSGFLLEGVVLRSDGFKQLDGGGNTGFERDEWMAKAFHRIDTGGYRHKFSAKFGFSHESSNETYLGLTRDDFRENPLRRYLGSAQDHMEWHRTQGVLTHRLEAPSGWTLTTTGYRQDFHRIWRKVNHFGGASLLDVLQSPQTPRNAIYYAVLTGQADSSSPNETLFIGPNNRSFVSQGVQSTFRHQFKTGFVHHAVEAQVRYHFDSIQRLHTEDGYLVRSGQLEWAGQPTVTLVDNRDATHALALNVSDAVGLGPVTLTPGVRVEVIRSDSRSFLAPPGTPVAYGSSNVVLPGIGGHWAITEQLGVLAGVYRGFSPPAPGQNNVGAQAELSMNAEAGARWARRNERAEVIGFFNDYANLTSVCTFSNGCINENLDRQFDAGRANIYGVEVFGEKTLRLGSLVSLPLSLAYTYTGSRLLQSFQSADPSLGDVQEGDELPYVPRHTLNVSAGVDVWKFGVHGNFTFIDRMRERAGQGDVDENWTTDAQVVLDLHVAFRFTDWAQVYFDARNVFDNHAIVGRLPYGARPNAPRMLIGGVKLQY